MLDYTITLPVSYGLGFEGTEHKGFLDVTLGDEVFTDLDFADDVALLARDVGNSHSFS